MKFLHNDLSPWLALMLRRRQRFLVGALLVWVTLLAGLALLGLSGWFIAACAWRALRWLLGCRHRWIFMCPAAAFVFLPCCALSLDIPSGSTTTIPC